MTQVSPPLIGMTAIIRDMNADFLQKNLYNPNFLSKICPSEKMKIMHEEGNWLHISNSFLINSPRPNLNGKEITLETDLVLEEKLGDLNSLHLWDFYTMKNNLCFSFGGHLRLKELPEGLKIGVYVYDFVLRNDILKELGEKATSYLIRDDIRAIFSNLQKFGKKDKR